MFVFVILLEPDYIRTDNENRRLKQQRRDQPLPGYMLFYAVPFWALTMILQKQFLRL
jgi:hypothetical protein